MYIRHKQTPNIFCSLKFIFELANACKMNRIQLFILQLICGQEKALNTDGLTRELIKRLSWAHMPSTNKKNK